MSYRHITQIKARAALKELAVVEAKYLALTSRYSLEAPGPVLMEIYTKDFWSGLVPTLKAARVCGHSVAVKLNHDHTTLKFYAIKS